MGVPLFHCSVVVVGWTGEYAGGLSDWKTDAAKWFSGIAGKSDARDTCASNLLNLFFVL